MSRFLFLFTLIIIKSAVSSAQIVLTSNTAVPVIGDSFAYRLDEFAAISVRHSGQNQVWDFSSAAGVYDTASYIALSNASQSSNYPSATVVETSASGEYYLSSTSGRLALEGEYADQQIEIFYSDKKEILKFPITYGDTYSETFAGTVEYSGSAQIYNRVGTTVIVADGYGTLVLPYTSINNVLRIRTVNTYVDSYMGFPMIYGADTVYTWYDINNKYPLAKFTSMTYFGQVYEYGEYMQQSTVVLDVQNVVDQTERINIYPNPSTGDLNIQNPGQANRVKISDICGRTILSASLHKGLWPLDIRTLSPSLYVLHFYNGKYIVQIERLIVY